MNITIYKRTRVATRAGRDVPFGALANYSYRLIKDNDK
jgi:hypothetical protein